MRMPLKMAALTAQVEPNSKDMLVTPRVSISRKAAPMTNIGRSKVVPLAPKSNAGRMVAVASTKTAPMIIR